MPIIRLVTIQIDFIIYMMLAILPVIYQVYLIHYYVIKFVSGFGQVGGFSVYTNNIDRHDISEILLKVALNTIIIAPCHLSSIIFGASILTVLFQRFSVWILEIVKHQNASMDC